MSFLELDTSYQKQKAALAVFGLMIILSTAFIGTWLSAIYLPPGMGLVGGFSCVVFVGGILGFMIVLVQQAVNQVNIKVIQEK